MFSLEQDVRVVFSQKSGMRGFLEKGGGRRVSTRALRQRLVTAIKRPPRVVLTFADSVVA